jgi:hypothetical protein
VDTADSVQRTTAICVSPSRVGLVTAEIAAILRKIAGGPIESEFRGRDPQRSGVLRPPEFSAALARLPVVLSGAEVRQLSGYYRLTGAAGIDYLGLLRDARDIPEPPPDEAPPPPPPPPPIPGAVRATLRRFKLFAAQRRISPADLFRPYDTASGGFLRDIRLPGIFRNAAFPSAPAEIEALTAAFHDPRRPEYFADAAFDAQVEREDIASPEVRAALVSIPAMPAVDFVANDACDTIRKKLLARNKRIANAFVRRIEDIGLILRPREAHAMIRKYQRHQNDVRWEEFCVDVEATGAIGP